MSEAGETLGLTERLIVAAASAGGVADFAYDYMTNGEETPVEADFLRRLLLGLPLTDSSSHRVTVAPTGLRLRFVRIEGTLDLDDARGGEAALPPIILEFSTLGTLSARHAHLTRLVLRSCSFTAINLDGARIDSAVDLAGSSSSVLDLVPTESGETSVVASCTISARGCRIDGSLLISHTALAVEAPELGDCLDLTDARIEGEVRLNPGFRARGRVRLDSAQVSGDVWAEGATLDGLGGDALSAQNTRVGGGMFLRSNALERLLVAGSLHLYGLRTASNLELTGAHIVGRPDVAITLTQADIGGSIQLSAQSLGEGRFNFFTVEGPIYMTGMHIGGTLFMRGARLDAGLPERYALLLDGSEIEGNLVLTPLAVSGAGLIRFAANGIISVDSCRIGGTLECHGLGLDYLVHPIQRTHVNPRFLIKWMHGLHLDPGEESDEWPEPPGILWRPCYDETGEDPTGWRMTLDLSNTRATTLNDQAGTNWGADVGLKLDGLIYGHLAHHTSGIDLPTTFPWIGRLTARLVGSRSATGARARRMWLALQYPSGRATPGTFLPQPFEQLASVLAAQGAGRDARSILSYKMRLESMGVSLLFKPIYWLYGLFFRYGLSPRRALLTFLLFILVGAVGAGLAAKRDLLVLDAMPVTVAVTPEGPASLIADTRRAVVEDAPCGSEITPWVYAVDLAIPILDLHEETRCNLRAARPDDPVVMTLRWPSLIEGRLLASHEIRGPDIWRFAKAIYALLGWLVTSLALLTVTGVLRRVAER
ncbi:MAG: hypothetical protein R3D33_01695 [Hyphomicrobiaceae bacterium]